MKLFKLSFQERFRLYILDPIRFAVAPYDLDLPDMVEMTEDEFETIDRLLPIRQAITGCMITLRLGPEWAKEDVCSALNSYLSVLMTMTYNDGLNILTRKFWPFEDEFWWMVEIGSIIPEKVEDVDDYVLRESVEIAAERYPVGLTFHMCNWYDNSRMRVNFNQSELSKVFRRRYDAVQKKMAEARKQQYDGDETWNKLYEEEEKVLNAWKEALLALK